MILVWIGVAWRADFYMRLHKPTRATTLDVGSWLLASSLLFSIRDCMLTIHEYLVTSHLFITAPVSAHMMAKAALHVDTDTLERTQGVEAHKAATAGGNPPAKADLVNKQKDGEN